MPVYEPNNIEYAISSGYMQVIAEDGTPFPAYGANPRLGGRFPCITLIHDWWGLTNVVRHIAHAFAQAGYRVIVPDLFDGQTANSAQSAINLVQQLGERGSERVKLALDVVEHHHHSNGTVAAVGIGMGGGLAFEAAIRRTNLEAAIALGGMPQSYLGRFKACKTPILAIYGDQDKLVSQEIVAKLRHELATADLHEQHHVEMISGLGHEFFISEDTPYHHEMNRVLMHKTLTFLDLHLKRGRGRKPASSR